MTGGKHISQRGLFDEVKPISRPQCSLGKAAPPEREATSVHTGLTSPTLRASCSKQVKMCPLPIGPLPPARQRQGLCQVPRESPWPASPVVKGWPRAPEPRIQDAGAGPVLRDSAALAPSVSVSSTKGAPGRYPGAVSLQQDWVQARRAIRSAKRNRCEGLILGNHIKNHSKIHLPVLGVQSKRKTRILVLPY